MGAIHHCWRSWALITAKGMLLILTTWRRTISILWASVRSVARRRLSGWSLHTSAPPFSRVYPSLFPERLLRWRVSISEGTDVAVTYLLKRLLWILTVGRLHRSQRRERTSCRLSLLRICGWTMLSNYPRYVFCKGYIHEESQWYLPKWLFLHFMTQANVFPGGNECEGCNGSEQPDVLASDLNEKKRCGQQ